MPKSIILVIAVTCFLNATHLQSQTGFEVPPALDEINHLEDVTPNPPYGSPIISAMARHHDGTRYIAGKLRGDVDMDLGPSLLVYSDDWGDPFVAIYPPGGAPIVHQFLNNQGSTGAEMLDLELDPEGNAYVLGTFDADWLIVGDGQPALPGNGNTKFVAKVNPLGQVQWAFSLPATPSTPMVDTLAVNNNRLVIGGKIGPTGADFDPDPNQVAFAAADNTSPPDPFFASYDLYGDFLWVKVIRQIASGPNQDIIGDLTYTSDNRLLIGGAFGSEADFQDGPGDYILSSERADAFLGMFDATGNPIWVQQLGGTGLAQARIEEIDHNNSIVTVVGFFQDMVDFDPDPVNVHLLSANPSNSFDQFIAAYDMNGTLLWVNLIDSNGGSIVWGDLKTSATGISALVGTASDFTSGVDFDPGPGDSENLAGGFFAFYAAEGGYLSAHSFGGPSNVFMTDVLWEGTRTIHGSGRFVNQIDMDPGVGETLLVPTTPVGAEMFFGRWSDFIFVNGFGQRR